MNDSDKETRSAFARGIAAARHVVVRGRFHGRADRAPRCARAAAPCRAQVPRSCAHRSRGAAYPDTALVLRLLLVVATHDSNRRARNSSRGGGRTAAATAKAEAAGGETEAAA